MNIEETTKMINPHNKFNGRIDLIGEQDPSIMFSLQSKISQRNKASPYMEALSGTWEDNILARVYFSMENIQIIQNGIRAGVYKMSGNKYVISVPNIDNLKIIMRSIYLQYAEHYPTNITKQVERLNKLVLDYAIPSIYNEAVGYEKYLFDQSTLVVPLEREQPPDRQYKQLELKPWISPII